MTYFASETNSEFEPMSAGSPDLDASSEVLTCRSTLRGAARSEGRMLFRDVAVLAEVSVWIVCRLGMAGKGRKLSAPSSQEGRWK